MRTKEGRCYFKGTATKQKKQLEKQQKLTRQGTQNESNSGFVQLNLAISERF